MKKLYALTLFIALSVPAALAQYKLSPYNAFTAGDKHEFVFTTNASEGLAGENITWDFSDLKKTDKTLTSNMFTYSTWDKTGIIPEANIAMEEAGNWFFFKVTSQGMDMYGSSNVCGNITRYDKPLAKLKYPFQYGDKISGNYSGAIINVNTAEIKITGTYEIIADAHGTLLLPDGITIKNALRVKQTRTLGTGDQKEITYRWYADGVRYPLLVMIKYESAQQSSVSVTALCANAKNATAPAPSIAKTEKKLRITSIKVMPNPFHGQLIVHYTIENAGTVKIDLIDANGKLVKNCVNQTFETGNYSNTINLNTDKVGTYFLRFTAGDEVITKKVVQN